MVVNLHEDAVDARRDACGAECVDHGDVTSRTVAQTARLLHVEGHPAETARWSFETLVPAPDYEAALAVEGHDWRLACWHYG